MEVLENEEGDIENILDEEAEKIREKEKKEKQELIAQLQDYKIKVYLKFSCKIIFQNWFWSIFINFCSFWKASI